VEDTTIIFPTFNQIQIIHLRIFQALTPGQPGMWGRFLAVAEDSL
jgi:hypothetical protein